MYKTLKYLLIASLVIVILDEVALSVAILKPFTMELRWYYPALILNVSRRITVVWMLSLVLFSVYLAKHKQNLSTNSIIILTVLLGLFVPLLLLLIVLENTH